MNDLIPNLKTIILVDHEWKTVFQVRNIYYELAHCNGLEFYYILS